MVRSLFTDELQIHSCKTIDNFLSYADEFYIEHDKQNIYRTLSDHFDVIATTQVEKAKDALQLFEEFIRPLTNPHIEHRDFHFEDRVLDAADLGINSTCSKRS